MKINLAITIVALSTLAALAGCAGMVGRTNYYTLNLPAPPDPPASEDAHTSVAIREFRAPAYLKQGAIVYKPAPEQIGFYAYHRWAIDPCQFVTDSIIARLGATGTFSRVKHYDGQPDADYLVSGRLEKLEEIDYEGGVRVEVAVSAQMTKLDTGTIVWSKAVSEVGEV
ncbi:MAG TPA: ABC-type transport auxiliary lipoprotein family protein, partial [Candidatus Polarisedimenticolia bacterium]|nr:ABC-type transport auxiliary lipoprotein family protein [Candidatus Polarisedimenticolia bacterium]